MTTIHPSPSAPLRDVHALHTAHDDPVVIVSAARTPMGSFQGVLSGQTAPQLGAVALKGALRRANLNGKTSWQLSGQSSGHPIGHFSPDMVDEVLMGCVLGAGVGQAPARQAALLAGLPFSAVCSTVNKACGSSMKTVMMAHDAIAVGTSQIVLAGGMESMSNAPYVLTKARSGQRLGHGQMFDHMFLDGLEDAYGGANQGRLMGTFAQDTADHYGFGREAQDAFARASTLRAQEAQSMGWFDDEIEAIELEGRAGTLRVHQDETPLKVQLDKIAKLKPAFAKAGQNGSVTAANSSSISDGAAVLLLMRASTASKLDLQPMARIVAHSGYAGEPCWFTTAPVFAMQKLLKQTGWSVADVDAFEINEAFAVVTMAAMRDLELPHDKVNVHGGACALGHPIGASGARILVSLMGVLKRLGKTRGVASLCIGGGEATAMAIEML